MADNNCSFVPPAPKNWTAEEASQVGRSSQELAIKAFYQIRAVFGAPLDGQYHLVRRHALVEGVRKSSEATWVYRTVEEVPVKLGHESGGRRRARVGNHLTAAHRGN